jgi:maltose-binding protein MalE
MVDEFAPTNLRARLAAVQDRIAQARSQLETHGIIGDQADALTNFIDQHDAIRGSLDSEGTITELQHSKASAQTDALESALHSWLEGVDGKFDHPARRTPNISV